MKMSTLNLNLGSPFPARINKKERTPSLRARRLQSSDKLTLSLSKQSTVAKNPKQKLRDGEYDLNKDHLDMVNCPLDDELRIQAFLEEENVKSVNLT